MIALTGGIGAGKSTVASMLVEKGAVLVDADRIAREVVEPGRPALAALVERFGPEILAEDGTLDRGALADVGFASEEAKRDLEAITHPAIGEEFLRRVAAAPDDAVVLHDIPLLAESTTRSGEDYAGVIVVEACAETRLDRLVDRGMARDDAQRRMAAQATDTQRRALATWVVDNGGDLAALEARVDEVWAAIEDLRAD